MAAVSRLAAKLVNFIYNDSKASLFIKELEKLLVNGKIKQVCLPSI